MDTKYISTSLYFLILEYYLSPCQGVREERPKGERKLRRGNEAIEGMSF
jgi:hypothetical protein